ncbi:MAG TPA: purine-nucleoside phosphorylase [Helicobacteraceae bacterium]|nr:purine-nucleoside phosphorylase [Helicobacteraceae bacterium]
MIICAGNNESFDFATPMGVGLIEMSMNLTRLCLFDKPEFLLFVGTAGSYGDKQIFDIVESKTAANIELGFLTKKAYTPLDNVVTTQTEAVADTLVNSSNYITTDEASALQMQKMGLSIENMEFFAFLRVAQEFNIPAGGVFCVTNFCNATAHEDFLKNHDEAKKRLGEHVMKRIKELTS